MLRLLHIENIAVIECCDIEFKNGFNVLTGETGAGKSIIIDSIGAVLGYRTTRDIVRNGAAKASVKAVFDNCGDEIKSWFQNNGYDFPDDGEIMISREISADGKSSARINGSPVTASVLKTLGILLINILGQHDSQQLLDPEAHHIFIDRYSECSEYNDLMEEYSEVFCALTSKKAEKKALDIDEAAKARQVEMLKYQINELESAELTENEDEFLFEQQKIMRESSRIIERITEASSAFSGVDEIPGITGALSAASRALSSVSSLSEKLSQLSSLISDMYYSAEDIEGELRAYLETLEFSEEDANRIESRLDTIHKLKRKYGNTVAEMLDYLENAKRELSDIEFSEERIASLDSEIAILEKKAEVLADKLFEIRSAAAVEFENRIIRELHDLDMKGARFVANIVKTDSLNERGCDTVEFLLAANVGEMPKPLEKIASGGELSRIMLAIKNALDENDFVSTLIFDEIDTGVSGRAAQKIAEKLYRLSVKKQVLCVTHLAQISAMSDTHFKIEKSTVGDRTYTNVTELDKSGREAELARITGGTSISEITIENAREMLDMARVHKETLVNA